MKRLTNSVRDYAWGSRTAIASLRRLPVPSAQPEAELWLGAHPSAPSLVSGEDGQVGLGTFVAQDPSAVLGAAVLDRFGPRLPYLMKLIAAAEPLSLQAHPDAARAAAGYAAEEAAGLARDDPARNYVDGNHKPELLVAVESSDVAGRGGSESSDVAGRGGSESNDVAGRGGSEVFDALCGFRDPERSATELESLGAAALTPVVTALRTGSVAQRLRGAVELLMDWPDGERTGLVAAASGHPLAARLGRRYPDDVGVIVALLLNEVRLRPYEAVFMPAGNLHAYLSGFGVEVMAASDNVVRGGLTAKRLDVAELLQVLRYEVLADPVVHPVALGPGLVTWPAPVADFSLTKAEIPGALTSPAAVRLPAGGPRIICCLRGPVELGSGGAPLRLEGGDSVFVGADEPAVVLTGPEAIVFQCTSSSQ